MIRKVLLQELLLALILDFNLIMYLSGKLVLCQGMRVEPVVHGLIPYVHGIWILCLEPLILFFISALGKLNGVGVNVWHFFQTLLLWVV